MYAKSAIVLAACFACYLAMPQDRAPTDQAYLFAADAETFLYQPLDTSFNCADQEFYGYFADVNNGCQVFHICLPIYDDFGARIDTAHWSFICGNATVFDQLTLTCNHFEDALPCAEAPSYYNTVEFGKVDDDGTK